MLSWMWLQSGNSANAMQNLWLFPVVELLWVVVSRQSDISLTRNMQSFLPTRHFNPVYLQLQLCRGICSRDVLWHKTTENKIKIKTMSLSN